VYVILVQKREDLPFLSEVNPRQAKVSHDRITSEADEIPGKNPEASTAVSTPAVLPKIKRNRKHQNNLTKT
jgi:hypothetical protein